MRIETVKIPGAGDVTLTGYIFERSKEMPNMVKRPAVLVIPGGAYQFCSDREAEPVAMIFAAQGYTTFVLRYSVGDGIGTWPNPLHDGENALKLIRARAEEWDVDPDRIAAIGFSAGGHLTAALGTIAKERPNALILGYPCIVDDVDCVKHARIQELPELVTEDTPPTFIFAASDDGLVPVHHSLKFATALAEKGVPFQLHIFDKGDHGFSVATHVVMPNRISQSNGKEAKRWTKMCIDWLNRLFHIEDTEN